MPHPSVDQRCAVCERATSLWCSRCQNTWYCSPEHMRGASAEPEYISVNTILFLADEEQPRITSVRCRPPQHPSQGRCPVPALQPYFDAPPNNVVLTQGLNGEPLRFPLHIFYSSSALNRSSPVNRAIYHITSGAAPKAWCGNVVAFKFNGARRQGYTDAGSNDLPALSAYFLSYQ
ncbi:hypothetical protein DFH08DRAFT_880840 [Mycena albidolilacea]|uniref:MYND-type domain-containing protein n=1 Tax=Mycena albidolilacea TaxID=1033008 RepID=A0AAD6ZPA5_9AGAR|nr:hypothetical protein DFH08DRAFT_880840 [Mycena albidolilacea]